MNFLNIEINFINFPELSFPEHYNTMHMDDRFPTAKFFTQLSLEFWKPAKA